MNLKGERGGSRAAWWSALAVAVVALVAVNLRPGVTSVGPVLQELLASFEENSVWGGILTALPAICFAVFGPLAVVVIFKFGVQYALLISMCIAALGFLARPWMQQGWLFLILSAIAFAGIAIANVTLPAFIKARFPNHTAPMMTIFGSLLGTGATLGTLVAIPLADVAPGGWRGSLTFWGVAAGLAAVPALVIALRAGVQPFRSRQADRKERLVRSKHAVAIAGLIGVQSLHAYAQFGWLAQMYRDGGVDAGLAGLTVSVFHAFGILGGLAMPIVVQRVRKLPVIVICFGILMVVGYLGVLYAPGVNGWLWASCLGIAGAAFPMALSLITARTRDPQMTARVSGFGQTIGYSLAVCGPIAMGLLLSWTGSWVVPIWVLIVLIVPLVYFGIVAASPGFVDDEIEPAT